MNPAISTFLAMGGKKILKETAPVLMDRLRQEIPGIIDSGFNWIKKEGPGLAKEAGNVIKRSWQRQEMIKDAAAIGIARFLGGKNMQMQPAMVNSSARIMHNIEPEPDIDRSY